MEERRTFSRRRTLLGGRIEFFERSTFDCVIRNLSEGGARVQCDQQIALPDVFDLVIDKNEERRTARAVWRLERDIGIRFFANVVTLRPKRAERFGA